MSKYSVAPVDAENHFGKDEIIVSKTDTKGRILYANDIFCRVAEMTTRELIGQPHSIIRHPDMPRAVFKLLWDTVAAGKEIFAYVKNMSKSGKYYWVIAHVTPSFDNHGNIAGYHSNRRCPTQESIEKISPLYAQILEKEQQHNNAKDGLLAGEALLHKTLADTGMSYSEFVWSLGK